MIFGSREKNKAESAPPRCAVITICEKITGRWGSPSQLKNTKPCLLETANVDVVEQGIGATAGQEYHAFLAAVVPVEGNTLQPPTFDISQHGKVAGILAFRPPDHRAAGIFTFDGDVLQTVGPGVDSQVFGNSWVLQNNVIVRPDLLQGVLNGAQLVVFANFVNPRRKGLVAGGTGIPPEQPEGGCDQTGQEHNDRDTAEGPPDPRTRKPGDELPAVPVPQGADEPPARLGRGVEREGEIVGNRNKLGIPGKRLFLFMRVKIRRSGNDDGTGLGAGPIR